MREGAVAPFRALSNGTSRTVVIVEAGMRSGTLTIAGWADILGVPCGAVPGSIHSEASVSTHHLIRQGGVLELHRGSEPPRY